MSFLVPFDNLFHDWLLPISNTRVATLWAHTADFLGNGLVLLSLVLFSAFFIPDAGKKKEFIVNSLTVFALCGIIGQALKFFIGRPRPGTGLGSWQVKLFSSENDFHSFPSGHATTAFSMALVLCHYFPKYRGLWISVATFISLGRLVGQSHFFTDIAASILIAFLVTDFVLKQRFYGMASLYSRLQPLKGWSKSVYMSGEK